MGYKHYDCAIIGGGVSGLALAILLARQGRSVALFEKEEYPFHKVCGEYLSNESVPFLQSLGTDFQKWQLPRISSLSLTNAGGTCIRRALDMGGIGLSRYELDNELAQLATSAGASLRTNTKVTGVAYTGDRFSIATAADTIQAKTVAGSYGKNSNIDVQLGRKYRAGHDKDLFIAVKYHVRTSFNRQSVEMHAFPGGYCGMSAIEDDKVNMSYICRAAGLKKYGGIPAMEAALLATNPYLRKYLAEAEFLFKKPLVISHLFFGIRPPVSDHILLTGDAAGNIAPLSGNGMSIALRSAMLAYRAINAHLSGSATLEQMEQAYARDYYRAFSARIQIARMIGGMLVNDRFTKLMFPVLKALPFLVDGMSRRIHGEVF